MRAAVTADPNADDATIDDGLDERRADHGGRHLDDEPDAYGRNRSACVACIVRVVMRFLLLWRW